jgi:hypothetical protein
MNPLAAVRQELLARYLYAWTPAALHHAKKVTYVDGNPSGPAVAAAIQLFAEFADMLAAHPLAVVLAGKPPDDGPPEDGPAQLDGQVQLDGQGELPEGLTVRLAGPDLPADLAAARALATPIFAYLAYLDSDRGLPAADLLTALGAARAGETLVTLDRQADPEAFRRSLLAAGFRFAVVAELVDNAGAAERLFFATSAVRSLERFKDALWAVDEYAGVRYRDPRASDHPPLDISLEPHVGPLRRALIAYLAADGGAEVTVAQLREYALSDTLYRPADVNRALHPLLAAGQVTREPERGRLTPQTLISLPSRR